MFDPLIGGPYIPMDFKKPLFNRKKVNTIRFLIKNESEIGGMSHVTFGFLRIWQKFLPWIDIFHIMIRNDLNLCD